MRYMIMQEAGDGDGGGGGGSLLGGGEAPAPGVVDSTPAPEPVEVAFPENWKEGLGEEYRNDPIFANVPDIPTLAKNYVHAQKSLGKKGVALPDQHSTADDVKAFYQQLGLPEAVEKYELTTPEDAGFEDGFLSEFRETAYAANILPEQANALLKWYTEANNAAVERATEQHKLDSQAAIDNLRKEWGGQFDRNLQVAKATLRAAGLEDVTSWLEQTGLGDEPMLIKLLTALGNQMKEDGVLDLGNDIGPSSQSLQKRLGELQGDPNGPLYNKAHPNHKAALEEVTKIFEQLYPAQA